MSEYSPKVIFVSGAGLSPEFANERKAVAEMFSKNGYAARHLVASNFEVFERFVKLRKVRDPFYIVDGIGDNGTRGGLELTGRLARLFGAYGCGFAVVTKDNSFINAETFDKLSSAHLVSSYGGLSERLSKEGVDRFVADLCAHSKESQGAVKYIRSIMQTTRKVTGTVSRTSAATSAPAPAPAG